MFEVSPGLFVGSDADCFHDNRDGFAVVHACKIHCHQNAVGYSGSLPSSHPNYLVFERGTHLYLNMIDPSKPLFMPPLFTQSLAFIKTNLKLGKVLIHCNQGNSRAPSLALLYLAKETKHIDGTSFDTAATAFRRLYPQYSPGQGIVTYLRQNWLTIGATF